MIGRPAHQAERPLGPVAMDAGAPDQVAGAGVSHIAL